MRQLQEIYWLNDMQLIAEGRFKLGSLKMGMDENPRILFFKLATLEHAYAHNKGGLMDDDMIRAIFAISSEKYRVMLNLVADNQGDSLQPSHLEAAMRKIWSQSGSSKGLSMVKKGTVIVLNGLTRICYVCKEKGHQATQCPNME